MEKNRDYFKNLLAEHSVDVLFDELFALINRSQSKAKDRLVAEKQDELILLSGKLNNAQQGQRLGTVSAEDLNIEVSRINFALLDLLNDLPDAVFQQAQQTAEKEEKKTYNIPSGIGKGLFWMASVVMLMITLGSLVQKNWLTFAFTAVATLICLPPSFDFVADKFKFTVSGSIRVLLIIILTSIGLSFAPKKEDATGKNDIQNSQPSTR